MNDAAINYLKYCLGSGDRVAWMPVNGEYQEISSIRDNKNEPSEIAILKNQNGKYIALWNVDENEIIVGNWMQLSTIINDDELGAVDISECPDRINLCKCGKCASCGQPKHSSVHAPFFGEKPGSKPYRCQYQIKKREYKR